MSSYHFLPCAVQSVWFNISQTDLHVALTAHSSIGVSFTFAKLIGLLYVRKRIGVVSFFGLTFYRVGLAENRDYGVSVLLYEASPLCRHGTRRCPELQFSVLNP